MSDKTKQAELARVRAWRDAAVADGWSIEPTYSTEEIERASRLKRDGFNVQILTREIEPGNRWRSFAEATIHVWGPDSLAVSPGSTYDFDYLKAGLRTCSHCRKADVATKRVGFAGRVCAECLPEQRRRIETPGWSN